MKNLKKFILTSSLTIATLFTIQVISNAATVKVTGEVVNVRKEASAESKVVAQLSENVECEYLGEEGNWYKVKYQKYTGYVSKEYTKLIGETNKVDKPENNENSNNITTNQNTNNNEISNQNNENTSQTNNSNQTNNEQEEQEKLVYKKFNQKTSIKILPLIYSTIIGEAKKDDKVLVLAETSGWTYIQTDDINGWVRTDSLVATTSEENKDDSTQKSNETTEKKGYINEEEVNMRKGAGTTYSIVKVLTLNTQVNILKEEGKWYQVKAGNTTGYVSKDYVSDSKTVTNRTLTEPRKTEDKEKDKNEDKETSITNQTENKVTNVSSNKDSNKVTSSLTNKDDSNSQNTTKGTDVIAYAKSFIGVPYVWGGASKSGFDCSGFTMYVYKHFGVSLPHYTVSQYNSKKGTKITKQKDLKIGDIVYLTDYITGAQCGHCGIYIGNGDFIHADSSVGYVNISNLNGIYKGRFCGALRIIK